MSSASRPTENVRFKLLAPVENPDAIARELIDAFLARKQALNPTDKADFTALIDNYAAKVLDWLPEQIPLKENVALVFGRLFTLCPVDLVLDKARAYLRTATDVLRLIAVRSGADAALQGETVIEQKVQYYRDMPWWKDWLETADKKWIRHYQDLSFTAHTPRQIYRFPVAKMPRSLRTRVDVDPRWLRRAHADRGHAAPPCVLGGGRRVSAPGRVRQALPQARARVRDRAQEEPRWCACGGVSWLSSASGDRRGEGRRRRHARGVAEAPR